MKMNFSVIWKTASKTGFCPAVVIFHSLEGCANEGSRKQLLDALLFWLFNSYIFFKQEDFLK